MDTNPFDMDTLDFQLYDMAPGEAFTWSRRVISTEPVQTISETKLSLKRFVQTRLNLFTRRNKAKRKFFRIEQGIIQVRNGDILVIVALTKR